MEHATLPRAAKSVSEAFFGDAALGVSAPPALVESEPPPRLIPGPSSSGARPASMLNRPAWVAPALVAAAALLAGVVLTLLFI
jgi:hypothetical protein